jgi:hypothetical protein
MSYRSAEDLKVEHGQKPEYHILKICTEYFLVRKTLQFVGYTDKQQST